MINQRNIQKDFPRAEDINLQIERVHQGPRKMSKNTFTLRFLIMKVQSTKKREDLKAYNEKQKAMKEVHIPLVLATV